MDDGNYSGFTYVDEPHIEHFHSENNRLASLVGSNAFSHKRAVELAFQGFYSKPSAAHADRVQCVFCLVVLSEWEPTDDVTTEHTKNGMHCPFLFGCAYRNRSIADGENQAKERRQLDVASKQIFMRDQMIQHQRLTDDPIQQQLHDRMLTRNSQDFNQRYENWYQKNKHGVCNVPPPPMPPPLPDTLN